MGQSSGVLFKEVSAFQSCPSIVEFTMFTIIYLSYVQYKANNIVHLQEYVQQA